MKHPTMNTTTHVRVQPTKKHPTTTIRTTNPSTTKTTIQTTSNGQPFRPATPYRPIPPPNHHRRHHHKCCTCWCCFLSILWITLIIIFLLVLAASAATVFYAIYRPRPPTFTVPILRITQLNLTSSSDEFTSKFNLTMTTNNPNDKTTFYYNRIIVSVHPNKEDITLGQGSFPSFVHPTNNLTSLFAPLNNKDIIIDYAKLNALKSEWEHGWLIVDIKIETEMSLKFDEKIKTNKFILQACCDGIKVHHAANKNNNVNYNVVKCKVELFIKIFAWNVRVLRSS